MVGLEIEIHLQTNVIEKVNKLIINVFSYFKDINLLSSSKSNQ